MTAMTKFEQIKDRLKIADEQVLGRETNDSPANNYHIAWGCYVNLVPYNETLERRIIRALTRRDEEVKHLVKIAELALMMTRYLDCLCGLSPEDPICPTCKMKALLNE